MHKQKLQGLCIFCREKTIGISNLCRVHYFKAIATRVLGDRNLAEDIENIFYVQEERCYLTGKKLVLGGNAELDHVLPISKYPHLSKSITNVRWCDKTVNRIKTDLEYEDLIKFCTAILNYFDRN